jgi:hypothetical protein
MPGTPLSAHGMNERGGFVPALVAGEPQKWQSYLRLEAALFLIDFPTGFRAARLVGLGARFFCDLAAARAGLRVRDPSVRLAGGLAGVTSTGLVRPSLGAL